MTHEVYTDPLTTMQIEGELAYFIEFFSSQGNAECDAFFGPAWGIAYYGDDRPWEPVRLSLMALDREVRRAGTLGWGGLGANNLYLTVPSTGLEFNFWNDSYVYLSFEEPDEVTEHFYQRWKSLGYRPKEWRKNEVGPPHELLRSEET